MPPAIYFPDQTLLICCSFLSPHPFPRPIRLPLETLHHQQPVLAHPLQHLRLREVGDDHLHDLAIRVLLLSGLCLSIQLIENHLFETGFPDAIVLRLHGSPEAVGTLCQGMVAVASEGGMLSANRSALYMLGMGMPGLRCHTFLSLFGQPVSTLFEQARREPDGLLPLVTFNGTHVFAQVSLGNRLRKACQPLLHMTIEEGPSATGIRGGAIDTGASAGKIRALTAGAEVRRSAGASQEMRGALESLFDTVGAALPHLSELITRDYFSHTEARRPVDL